MMHTKWIDYLSKQRHLSYSASAAFFCMTNPPFLLAIASDSDFAVYPLFLGVKETTYE